MTNIEKIEQAIKNLLAIPKCKYQHYRKLADIKESEIRAIAGFISQASLDPVLTQGNYFPAQISDLQKELSKRKMSIQIDGKYIDISQLIHLRHVGKTKIIFSINDDQVVALHKAVMSSGLHYTKIIMDCIMVYSTLRN